jgi:hypothetical protein
MWTDSRPIDRSGPDVRRLRPSSIDAFDRECDVLDQLFEFQNTSPSGRPTPPLTRHPHRFENRDSYCVRAAPHVAFPHSDYRPTEFSKVTRHESVTSTVGLDLWNPVRRIPTCRELAFSRRPTSTMPKIAVAENNNAGSQDRQVGAPRNIQRMQAKTNTSAPEGLSQQDLRSGILTTIADPDAAGRDVARTKALVPRHRASSLLGRHALHSVEAIVASCLGYSTRSV